MEIKNKKIDYPIIQGGMGVGISLGNLSGHIAKNGAMGVISMVGIGYMEDDFYKDTPMANKRSFKREVQKARQIADGNGLIGVNIMHALTDFDSMVQMAVEEDVDFIISGAGLPLNLPEIVGDKDILIAPIVSSLKALKLIIKIWTKRYNRLPDFLVIEGKDAGGHLGFKLKDLDNGKKLEDIVVEIIDYLNEENLDIKVFVAGSVYDGYDLKKYRDLGAFGIQIGTRFIATEECDASYEFKEMIKNGKSEDLTIIKSPAGMPARALNNKFIDRISKDRVLSKRCINCLKTCNPKETDFCISDALINSVKGDVENGLIFSGENIDRIDKITNVDTIIDEIVREWKDI